MNDLVIVVADADMEGAVRGLLPRTKALGLQSRITFHVIRHPRRDPGVFHEAHEWLRPLKQKYRYALVMLDREGSGQERRSAQEIEQAVQRKLDRSGWKERSAVVVMDPELEVWVFSPSRHVVEIVADGDLQTFRKVLRLAPTRSDGKPRRPKETMEAILRTKRIPRSSDIYRSLAERVTLSGCRDPSFQKFRQILRTWFGQ